MSTVAQIPQTTPIASGEPKGQPAGPCVMVIFGASGDLTKRKLIPALYNLTRSHYLADNFAVVGFAFDAMSTEQFRESISTAARELDEAPVEPESWSRFVQRLYYMQGDFSDAAAFDRLRDLMNEVSLCHNTEGNYLFYLATSPTFFSKVIEQLGRAKLVDEEEGHWRRVVIEKPFGHDLASSVELNRQISKILDEDQIYRIDHYLGKETVQNMMIFRFSNGIFEPVWNRRYIDHVQITVAEAIGVERRGGYYETAGALRDMVPNHLLQLVSLTAMEPPNSFAADAVRDEKSKVIQAIQPIHPDECLHCAVRGQYGPGEIEGKPVPGYRQEPNVKPDSATDTFVALKLTLDNWRWAGVPFYLRTGKRMAKRVSEITIQFKQPPFVLFRQTPVEHLKPNLLVIQIQPDEGIWLRFGAKTPGPFVDIGAVKMNFKYADYFGRTPSTGYETLIYDCMIGDSTLFQRADMVEAGWSAIEPLLETWGARRPEDFPNYAAGSWGPQEAEELLRRDGRHWRSTVE
jgi:glucose-6-phosphate 1-dehydrogenase